MYPALVFDANDAKMQIVNRDRRVCRDRFWRVLALLLVLLKPLGCLAASAPNGKYVIDSWGTDEGLPQNSVTSILQARDGYLWFGTMNGLVRFDGSRFLVLDKNNTPELKNNWIERLFEDEKGRIWIGTRNAGIVLLKNGKPIRPGIGKDNLECRLVSACQEPGGSVWLYTADGQVWRYNEGRFDVSVLGLGRPSNYRSIISDSSGTVWIGADWCLYSMSSKRDVGSLELPIQNSIPITRLDYLLASKTNGFWCMSDNSVRRWKDGKVSADLGSYPWKTALITSACEDADGNLIVGTLGLGVFWFDSSGNSTRISAAQGLLRDSVLSLCFDKEGDLWVGTDGGGISRIKRRLFEVLDIASVFPQFPSQAVPQSVAADTEGGMWIGYNGGGLVYWKEGAETHFDYNHGLVNSHVWSVLVDQKHQVWVGTFGSGLFNVQGNRCVPVVGVPDTFKNITALFQDRQGTLWIGSEGGLASWRDEKWIVWGVEKGVPTGAVQSIAEDKEGSIWASVAGTGLICIRGGKCFVYRAKEGLPSEDVSCIQIDEKGVVWIGTAGSGLGCFRNGKWSRISTKEGLLSDSVAYIVLEGTDVFWIGSNLGIMRMQKSDLLLCVDGKSAFVTGRSYGKPDGLPTRECTQSSQPAGCRSSDGRLWFPTIRGLASVDPALLNPNLNPPPVRIEDVLIDGRALGTGILSEVPKSVTVPSNSERIEIHYTSLNLSSPDQGRFRYQMENYEKEWFEAGNMRVAYYPHLPPGRYRFHVQACNQDKVWNEAGAELAITVLSPFWHERWFIILVSASALGLVVLGVYSVSAIRFRRQLQVSKQREAIERERTRIARDIHDQLGASMMHVALLGELIESDKDDPKEVESHAQQVCQAARDTSRTLDEIVWAVNPANDTLDGLMTYLCKYAQEFLNLAGIGCRLDLPDQLPSRMLPPELRHNMFLAFKEAITNIVKHSGATETHIRLFMKEKEFRLEIEDNGKGPGGMNNQAAQSRNGLKNMRQRMSAIGGNFDIQPGASGGTLVLLEGPLHTIE